MARFALKAWLESDTGTPALRVCGTASNGKDTLRQLPESGADIALVDIDLPDMTGIEIIREARTSGFTKPILAMSGSNTASLHDVLTNGANGFVSKTEGNEHFVDAIRFVAEHPTEKWLSPSAHRQMMLSQNLLEKSGLTPAEISILRHINFSNKEIAETLNLSESTVKNHLWSIFQKIGISSRHEALEFAVKSGLIAARIHTVAGRK